MLTSSAQLQPHSPVESTVTASSHPELAVEYSTAVLSTGCAECRTSTPQLGSRIKHLHRVQRPATAEARCIEYSALIYRSLAKQLIGAVSAATKSGLLLVGVQSAQHPQLATHRNAAATVSCCGRWEKTTPLPPHRVEHQSSQRRCPAAIAYQGHHTGSV